ncbi:MAG: signal recognition particle protein [Candidatus Dadabacteria bacterium]|nr:MAG: signal recognition particle protein [Candidatus Dadabacteria bacterium]
MFDSLSEKLSGVFRSLRGKGRLGERDIQAALREVRLALLEADVHYRVVRDFVEAVRERAQGQEVLRSLTPAQTVVKIVHDELVRMMGAHAAPLDVGGKPPVPVMLVGLQGSGKTTTAGKLALHLKRRLGRDPYLVPADVYRPAAIDQLHKVASDVGVPAYPSRPDQDPVEICRAALEEARRGGYDTLLVDTAGRLHVDEELMEELRRLKDLLDPREVLLVADAMTGQDAVNVAKAFDEAVGITGVVLTKADGDARGGAALSIQAVTKRPIKLVGVGEKLDALEVFHPERMASRILGMGDVLSLIEKAEQAIDEDSARDLEEKLRKNRFTLEDFRDQLRMLRKLGSLEDLLKMVPGMGQMKNLQVDERELVRVIAIIDSMTPEERRKPEILNASRRRRIARGSGTRVEDVNRLIRRYQDARKMMKRMGMMGLGKKGGKKKRKGGWMPRLPLGG